MPVLYKTGKRPPIEDARVPRLSWFTQGKLPAAPATYMHWAETIQDWGMLGNDMFGDCVEAAILHWIMQMSAAAGRPLVATTFDAITFYGFTGFIPTDPATDKGTYMLGADGAMQHWLQHGVNIGGVLDKVSGFLQIKRRDPTEWMQAIYYFGGMLTGIQLPTSILSGATVPAVWQDYSGPVDGGHEILINGYETASTGRVYSLVSWGQEYLATEAFLQHVIDETVVALDSVELNAKGVTTLGLNMAQLAADMRLLARGG